MDVFTLSGGIAPKKRGLVVREFRESPKSAVLIVSSVGVNGLNLDFANIIIVFVSDTKMLFASI